MQPEFQLDVIGCGDAYDGTRTNASVLISEHCSTGGHFRLLIDCGPTVPAALWDRGQTAQDLDAIYLTHGHPDHCLGLTTLLNWMDAHGRQRPLRLIAQKDQWPLLEPLIRFAHWPEPELKFALIRQESESVSAIGPWQIQTAPTRHAVANLSLHLTTGSGHQVFYSGDGQPGREGIRLAAQSDWVFLECETLSQHHSHGSWEEIAPISRKPGSQWRLYHIDPVYRPGLQQKIAGQAGLLLAEDGQRLHTLNNEQQACESKTLLIKNRANQKHG